MSVCGVIQSSKSAIKKLQRKLNRCLKIAQKLHGLEVSEIPTTTLFVGNGGLVSGVDVICLLELFHSFGSINDIITLPEKSYSFVTFEFVESAKQAVEELNGKDVLGEERRPLYLAFLKQAPIVDHKHIEKLPDGAILIEDFVTAEEEEMLLKSVQVGLEESKQQSLKHRLVWHYGYAFDYKTNNVDASQPLQQKIPEECETLLLRCVNQQFVNSMPDQLTINHYLPGQGIPQHTDTHSAFEDGILSLSLGSHVTMEFRHTSKERQSVHLPRRSLLVMKGESRYVWTHGITSRKNDIVWLRTDDGKKHLSLKQRLPRTSFTFRIVRREEGCNCGYEEFCDSEKNKQTELHLTNDQAKHLESQHVYEVYNKIADHFSETRHKQWPRIAAFLSELPSGSLLLDVGCGNGKYLNGHAHLVKMGCDLSSSLLEICRERQHEVALTNVLQLPFRDNVADACLCIAVLHHLATQERRSLAIMEIIRSLSPNGRALIYVWAMEQEDLFGGPSNYINPSRTAKQTNVGTLKDEDILGLRLPVHVNRTPFSQQDMLVPWKNMENDSVAHRFYHVFHKGELDSLVQGNNDIIVLDSFYDKGNWCLLLQKKNFK